MYEMTCTHINMFQFSYINMYHIFLVLIVILLLILLETLHLHL